MDWLLYCRARFEPELAAELADLAAQRGWAAYVQAVRDESYVRFRSVPDDGVLRARSLVFARQALPIAAELTGLEKGARAEPILAALGDRPVADVFVEPPDSDAGRELHALCKGLEGALVQALRRTRQLVPEAPHRLHVFVPAGDRAIACIAEVALASPWRMGIPRVRVDRDAPSRSAGKLEEAFLVLMSESERERWLVPGMTAVDLGAAPGGWTWQLARRSIRVVAVDNGPLAPQVLETGIVEHERTDGFRFRPRKPVDWLVCDMVEQPARVAALVGGWLRDGACRRALFNLKLPMKKRWDEIQRCLAILGETAESDLDARVKHLYHDREEVTVFVRPA